MPELLFGKPIPEHFGYRSWVFLDEDELRFKDSICFKGQKDKHCYSIFYDSNRRRIETSYYIGVDWLKNQELVIQVEPKINSEEKQTDYLKMLSVAMSHPGVSKYVKDIYEIKFKSEPILINKQDDLITPLLVIQYINLLKNIVRNGLIKSYHKKESNLKGKIKGKVLIGPTIKENQLKSKILFTKCSYDVFDEDVPINRILKKALDFSKKYMQTFNIKLDQDKLNYISPAFEKVSSEVNLSSVKNTKVNSFYKEYNEALSIAEQIMRRFGYNINSINNKDKIKVPPFWIDMSLLFELYTLSLLKNELSNEVIFQFNASYGFPDYLIKSLKVVADAKYKPIYQSNSVDIENIRQISGYGRDKKIREVLKADEKEELDCWIIYPDQLSGNEDLSSFNDKLERINNFSGFHKIGIKLPLIKL